MHDLRTTLSSYHGGLQGQLNELDSSCKTSLAALELIAQEAAAGVEHMHVMVNESNPEFASKPLEVANAFEDRDNR